MIFAPPLALVVAAVLARSLRPGLVFQVKVYCIYSGIYGVIYGLYNKDNGKEHGSYYIILGKSLPTVNLDPVRSITTSKYGYTTGLLYSYIGFSR